MDGENRRPNIIIIDDEQSVVDVLAIIAKAAGFEPAATTRPEDGLKLCADGDRAALIILDVIMPGLSGLELASRISGGDVSAQFLFTTGLPFSAWSAHHREELATLRPGAYCLLPKPFTRQSLLECLRCRLEGKSRLPECPKHGLISIAPEPQP